VVKLLRRLVGANSLVPTLFPALVLAQLLALTASHWAAADTAGNEQQPKQLPVNQHLFRQQLSKQQLSKQQLGQLLFADVRLSVNNRYSCASCHQPNRYFTDGLPVAIGALGRKLQRNTPTLLNVARQASFGWTDDGVTDLATQHLQPLLNSEPIELGFTSAQAQQLDQDSQLNPLRAEAFPQSSNFDLRLITDALAAYVATLRYTSSFDRYLLSDDATALSAAAKRGLALFTSERTHCVACHNGPLLGGGYRADGIEGKRLLPARYEQRRVAEGRLAIRVPSLRAVAFTAPYMIDGRLQDLPSVLAFYQAGELPELPNLTLTEAETQDLLAFLQQL
jgi:cytochrome c peroxidase